MATALPSLRELRRINFGDCLLRSGGARAIAAAITDGHPQLEVRVYEPFFISLPLSPSPSPSLPLSLPLSLSLLQEVCLGFNSLDVSSALAVAEALSNKKDLKKIDLNG